MSYYLCNNDPILGNNQCNVPVSSCGADSESPPLPVLLTLRGGCKKGAMIPAVRELEVGCIRTLQPVAKKVLTLTYINLGYCQYPCLWYAVIP